MDKWTATGPAVATRRPSLTLFPFGLTTEPAHHYSSWEEKPKPRSTGGEDGRHPGQKARELIRYVSERCEADRHFGATKLNKILFFADFLFYQKSGRSITGQDYQRLPSGPAPRLLPVRQTLVDAGDLAVRERLTHGRTQLRTIAIREVDLSGFGGDEIAVVDHVIRVLWDHSAAEASDLSHTLTGWRLARDGETIPYETVFLSERKLTQEEADYALQLVAA